MYSIEQVKAFINTYESGSYSKAAKRLGRNRTSVRELVKSLEDVWDVTLFNIVGRTAEPTAEAQALYYRASILLRNHELLAAHSKVVADADGYVLTVALDHYVPSSLVAEVEQALLERYPTVEVRWLMIPRQEALDGLINGSCDFALLEGRGKTHAEKEVEISLIGYCRLNVYVGKNSPLLESQPISVGRLELEPQYIHSLDAQNQGAIRRLSTNCREVGNDELIIKLLEAGGYACLPFEVGEQAVKMGRLKRLNTELTQAKETLLPITLFYPTKNRNHGVVSTAIELCKQAGSQFLK
ncbi:LysR family transcriptional regulator [Vibrio sp. WXL103]|uniref:LysR family transcriptional regulator n=1 Tax=Vibrio sp. WXL103 TaxID=3450710 RepID=UPI003EC7D8D9